MISQVKLLFLLIGTLCVSFPSSANEAVAPIVISGEIPEDIRSQLPSPPEGFGWKLYKNALFLKPSKWNERERASSDKGITMTVYAASPEEFSESKQFEMGITIQIISDSYKNHGAKAEQVIPIYLKPIVDTHKKEDVLMYAKKRIGDFESTIFRYRDAPAGLTPIIVHKFILANNTTDSVHIFTYESSEITWDENWDKYGTPFLSKVNVISTLPSI
tara:strand:- start:5867 stop:6517 length:651 start_codon:yes stop_codon:yes gene_type:complete